MANTTEEYYNEEDDVIPMTPSVQIPSGIGLGILIVSGILGNTMTIAAYFKDSNLNAVYDFFIFNLAMTDLLICGISMPFYAVYTLTEFTWPFGYGFCKVWLVVDFTLCFESILLMLILSLDRLLLITVGPLYLQKFTKRIAGATIAGSWIISFAVYGPAIIGWNHWVGYSTVEYMDCDVEFANDVIFTTVTAIVEFILPFVCLTTLNILIYLKIRQRLKAAPSVSRNSIYRPQEMTSNKSEIGALSNTDTEQNNDKVDGTSTKALSNANGNTESFNVDSCNGDDQRILDGGRTARSPQMNNASADNNRQNGSDQLQTRVDTGNQDKKAKRLVKAAKFLAILVAAFLILWTPYTVTTIIISFCDKCVNASLYEFFSWVLWMKSALNPLLYAFNSRRYRKHFIRYATINHRLYRRQTVGDADRNTTVTSGNEHYFNA